MVFTFPFGDPLSAGQIARSTDAVHFNRVANHDSVRPTLGGDGPIELSALLDDVRNFAFATPHGGFILWHLGAGRYDVHSLFLPEGRGEEALTAMAQVATYMFTQTDCVEGRTTVPAGNPGAAVLARRGGFEARFELGRMPWTATTTTRAAFLSLTLERWALTSPLTLAAGRWFHEALDTVKRAADSDKAVHPDEPVHDQIAGAAVLMIQGGQVDKAIAFFNCWAGAARYGLISQVSKRPCVLDIGDAVIEARGNAMAVLKCR